MKILWLCSWYPNKLDTFGGDFIERHAKALSALLPVDVIHIVQNHSLLQKKATGFEISNDHNLRFFLKIIPYHITPFSVLNKIIFNQRYMRQLKKILDQYIQENGKPDLVHVHVPVKIGAGALYLKKKYQIPYVVTEHNSAYFPHIPLNYHSNNFYYQYITRKTFKEAAAVSSVSYWLLKRLKDIFHLNTLHLIRNTVDESLFYYQENYNVAKRFIHVSMMDPLKNVVGIIKAFIELNKSNNNWQLVLVGPPTEDCVQLAEQGGIDHLITWTGLISYKEVAQQMRMSDALVHFSFYENLPCVVSEALCCGLTVISSDVGGIHELVTPQNGILIEPDNVDSLKEALHTYLSDYSRYDRAHIAQKSRLSFGYPAIAKELYNWYLQVLNRQQAAS